jgi:LysR family hydrogen peroxide-inducible transcriptional activator
MSYAQHPFTLRQLQYAVAVAESLSFRKAAERCHVSQPSLSAQLAQMEGALGVRLFERDRRRVLVTGAGREIIERARLVLRETDDLVELARRSADPLSGTLRIGVIPTISPYLLPRLTAALREAYPRLTVLWVEDKTEVLVRSLDSGTLDAALLVLEADIGDVDHEVIGSDAFVLATPAGHPLGAKASSAKPSELKDESVLLLDEGHCFGKQALALCSEAGAHALEFRATSLSTLAQMVAGGAGVTLLPELAVATETRRAELSIRPFTQPAPRRTIALVWRRRSPLGPALRQLATTAGAAYGHASASSATRRSSGKPRTARRPPLNLGGGQPPAPVRPAAR